MTAEAPTYKPAEYREGTTVEGERNVLMTEELFMDLIDAAEKANGQKYHVEWDQKTTGTMTFYAPSVWVAEEEDVSPDAG